MLDYKKILIDYDFKDMNLEVFQSKNEKRVEIGGNKKGLLYLTCKLAEFLDENFTEDNFAEMNFDAGIDLVSGSSSLCIFIYEEQKQEGI